MNTAIPAVSSTETPPRSERRSHTSMCTFTHKGTGTERDSASRDEAQRAGHMGSTQIHGSSTAFLHTPQHTYTHTCPPYAEHHAPSSPPVETHTTYSPRRASRPLPDTETLLNLSTETNPIPPRRKMCPSAIPPLLTHTAPPNPLQMETPKQTHTEKHTFPTVSPAQLQC